MIVSRDTKPERQLYHVGALLLEALGDFPKRASEPFELFAHVNSKEAVSATMFALALDWLFLLGAIECKDRRVARCS